MKTDKQLKHIIIQAGGLGSRMEELTYNKPKALISVGGEPMIMRLMSRYPDARYYIIADYKTDVLTEYLKTFAKQFDYKIIKAVGTGTCSGIRSALKFVPSKTPVGIVWCDLYIEKDLYPEKLKLDEAHYIGLSNTFSCRWSYKDGILKEQKSGADGIAGVYLFQEKKVLSGVPSSGEFCRFLKNAPFTMKPYYLESVSEVGTKTAYETLTSKLPNTRPFNDLQVGAKLVTKRPLNSHGADLAVSEKAWYKEASKYKWKFVPKIASFQPLQMQRIQGESIFNSPVKKKQKRAILGQIIQDINTIHAAPVRAKIPLDTTNNDYQALLAKTKTRLDSVIHLIPHGNEKEISVNGKKCINIYKQWSLLEKMCEPYLGKSSYNFIHGDPTFSNIMYEPPTDKVFLLDPRGYYGKVKLLGDPDYDWAKLYYSLIGNYDQFNVKKFILKLKDDEVRIKIASNGWEYLEKEFFAQSKADKQKVKLMHAIIWLSLTSYAWDNYDSICGAFYNGVYLIQDYIKEYEKTL